MTENQEEEDHRVIKELLCGEKFPKSKRKRCVVFSQNKQSHITDSLTLLVISNLKGCMYCIHLFKTHSLKAPEKYQKNLFLKKTVLGGRYYERCLCTDNLE